MVPWPGWRETPPHHLVAGGIIEPARLLHTALGDDGKYLFINRRRTGDMKFTSFWWTASQYSTNARAPPFYLQRRMVQAFGNKTG